MTDKYEDIINMLHHVSKKRVPMSMWDRAAQFSPFAALTGYDAAIKETGRLTGERIELGDEDKAILDAKICFLQDIITEHPEIAVTYFVPDELKEGGEYVSVVGVLKRIDYYERLLRFANGSEISLENVLNIEVRAYK